jgi:hypothetical protein
VATVASALAWVACATRQSQPAAAPSTAPSAGIADASAEAGAAVSHIRFAVEAQGGERALFIEDDRGAVHERVGPLGAGQLCTVQYEALREAALNVGCGLTMYARARFERPYPAPPGTDSEPKSIVLTVGSVPPDKEGGRGIDLAPGLHYVFDETFADPSAPGCVATSGPAPRVDVQVERQWGHNPEVPGAPVLVLRVPAAKFTYPMPLDVYEYCHGHRFPAAHRLQIDCREFGSSSVPKVEERGGALFASIRWYGEDGGQLALFGGVPLPCNATVALPRVHWPNPKWQPYGQSARCAYGFDLCNDSCEDLSDAEGEFREAGADCTRRCGDARSACEGRPTAK